MRVVYFIYILRSLYDADNIDVPHHPRPTPPHLSGCTASLSRVSRQLTTTKLCAQFRHLSSMRTLATRMSKRTQQQQPRMLQPSKAWKTPLPTTKL